MYRDIHRVSEYMNIRFRRVPKYVYAGIDTVIYRDICRMSV